MLENENVASVEVLTTSVAVLTTSVLVLTTSVLVLTTSVLVLTTSITVLANSVILLTISVHHRARRWPAVEPRLHLHGVIAFSTNVMAFRDRTLSATHDGCEA